MKETFSYVSHVDTDNLSLYTPCSAPTYVHQIQCLIYEFPFPVDIMDRVVLKSDSWFQASIPTDNGGMNASAHYHTYVHIVSEVRGSMFIMATFKV